MPYKHDVGSSILSSPMCGCGWRVQNNLLGMIHDPD